VKLLPKAGMPGGLPALMRLMMNSSDLSVPASFGPRPATRPPLWWHQPQEVAKSRSTLMLPGWPGLGGVWACARVGCERARSTQTIIEASPNSFEEAID
jgi:hypothetical protein